MADTRKLERTVRIGTAVFDAADKTGPDKLQAALTAEQGQALLDRGAISGEGWEFSGTTDSQAGLVNGTSGTGTTLEPDGAPGGSTGGTGTQTTTKALSDMTRRELDAEMTRRNLDPAKVTGTGADGALKNADLVAYLEANPGTPAGAVTTEPTGADTP